MYESLLAAVLGLVQGLTEFLPISSSGHLRLVGAMFDLKDPDTLFDVAVHAGTLGAVCAVYRRETWTMVRSVTNPSWENPGFRLAMLVLLGTIPVAVVGLLFGGWLETNTTSVPMVGGFLILNGIVLMASRGRGAEGRSLDQLTIVDAVVVGLAQSVALLRGVSRSGTTITTALLRGVDRQAAATFGFLLAIPAIAGAALLHIVKVAWTDTVNWLPLAVGTVTAALVGFVALTVLVKLVNRGQLHHFSWYCWVLGLTAIAVSVIG